MVNGEFEYTLILPTPTTNNVEVKTSEDGQNFTTVGGVTVQTDTLTITGLNHFTVFVVVGTISGSTATAFLEASDAVVINEFLFVGDNDWIELYNKGTASRDLSGWVLEDSTSVMKTLTQTISAKGFLTVDVLNRLNTDNDTIVLKDNSGTTVSRVSYKDGVITVDGAQDIGTVGTGESVARTADGGANWDVDTTPSKGWSNTLSSPTSVYVDSTYTDLETGTQNQPFNTIQEGIDEVASDGIVSVSAGTYIENLTINKSLTLSGVGNTTIISGSVESTGDVVTIQNLKVTNAYPHPGYGIKATAGKTLSLKNVTVDVLHDGVYMKSVDFINTTTINISNSDITGYSAIELADPSSIYNDENAAINVNISDTTLTGTTSYGGAENDYQTIGIDFTNNVHITFTGTNSVKNEFTDDATSRERLAWFYYANNSSISGAPIYTNAANSTVNDDALFMSANDDNNTVQGQIVARYVTDSVELEAALASPATTPIVVGSDYGTFGTTKNNTLNTGTTLRIEANSPVTINTGNMFTNNGTINLEPNATLTNNGTINGTGTIKTCVNVEGIYGCFSNIQSAITSVPAGGTVHVAAGTYDLTSRIDVTKAVSIIGDITTPSNVVINAPVAGGTQHGQNSVFMITSSDVTIQGFKIQGALHTGAAQNAGIYVDDPRLVTNPGLSNITISDNELTNNGWGIFVHNIKNSTISNNKVYSNKSTATVGMEYDAGSGIVVYGRTQDDNHTYNLTINNNQVYSNETDGIRVDVSSSVGASDWINDLAITISNNTVYDNGRTILGVDKYIGIKSSGMSKGVTVSTNVIYGHAMSAVPSTSNQSAGIWIAPSNSWQITDNNMHDNTNGIIFMYSATGSGDHAIIGNDIHTNTRGISINDGSIAVANNNSIYSNDSTAFSAIGFAPYNVYNSGSDTFDATNNWWNTVDADRVSDQINDISIVEFEPYCATADCTSFFIPGPTGSVIEGANLSIPNGSAIDSTSSVTFLDDFTISIGGSSVFIPAGTVITKTGGGNIDASLLSAASVADGTLSGLGTGTVLDGALQWGIPSIGLTFSPAITLKIAVDTSLNGQILNIRHSTSGSSDWTGDGIVSPGTCTVTAGICEFQTTKASYYATTHTTSSSTSNSNSSSTLSTAGAPVCNDTKPGSAPTLLSAIAGFNSVTLTWSKAVNPVSYYLMTFGTSAGSQTYGNPNVGGADTTSYTVSSLSGGATYYFRIRAGNGCAPGDFSNELFATPTGGFIEGVPAGFEAGVLGETTNSEESEEITEESTPTGTALGLQTKDDTTNSWWWPWILLSLLPLGWIVYKKWKK